MRRTLPLAALVALFVASPALAASHRVVRGDTLSEIAQRYGISLGSLRAANGISGDLIRVGQVLDIPNSGLPSGPASAARFVTVRRGDTLSHIALRHGTTVRALKQTNGLSGDLIRVGQRLRLPGASSTPTSPAQPISQGGGAQTVTVRSGDTLSHIAQRTGTTVNAIMQRNGLTSHLIHPGQELRVSGSAGSTSPAPAPVSSSRLARIQALNYTQADVEALARIIKGETPAHTPFSGQVAVGAVVLNRVFDSRWPNTIRGVIHQRKQFSAYNANVRQRLYFGPIPARAWRAARAALAGQDPSAGANHYFNPFLVRPSWAKRLTFIKQIGTTRTTAHAFYR